MPRTPQNHAERPAILLARLIVKVAKHCDIKSLNVTVLE